MFGRFRPLSSMLSDLRADRGLLLDVMKDAAPLADIVRGAAQDGKIVAEDSLASAAFYSQSFWEMTGLDHRLFADDLIQRLDAARDTMADRSRAFDHANQRGWKGDAGRAEDEWGAARDQADEYEALLDRGGLRAAAETLSRTLIDAAHHREVLRTAVRQLALMYGDATGEFTVTVTRDEERAGCSAVRVAWVIRDRAGSEIATMTDTMVGSLASPDNERLEEFVRSQHGLYKGMLDNPHALPNLAEIAAASSISISVDM